jgi:hypothetical protein
LTKCRKGGDIVLAGNKRFVSGRSNRLCFIISIKIFQNIGMNFEVI